MDSINSLYPLFQFDWTVKSTTYLIKYRRAFDINEVDEIFCSIVHAKGGSINKNDFAKLLGFNLKDLAEADILSSYLKGLVDYNLIECVDETLILTDYGGGALNSKLKYKHYLGVAELYENQTAVGETFDFSFKKAFDLESKITLIRQKEQSITFVNPELQQKLQNQLFDNDVYKGEIIELIDHNPNINYRTLALHCELTSIGDFFEINILKAGLSRANLTSLVKDELNVELKNSLIRKGKFGYILLNNNSITAQDIKAYIDLWDWKELASNPKVDWDNKEIFELFRGNGDGSIWSEISKIAPIGSIKEVILEYAGYWNWTALTERFDNGFILTHIESYNWDFEELSYKEVDFVTTLLPNKILKDRDWDWQYLSKNLSNKFIENHIDDFPWDFYEVTTSKNEVFKNVFIKYRDKLETVIVKPWNWQYISKEININFLYKNISVLAAKIDWHIVLNRFFNDKVVTDKCIKDLSFKSILVEHLPPNYTISHQKFFWTKELIEYLEELKLIQWQTSAYTNGSDTNPNLKWSSDIFRNFQNLVTTENGYFNVSQYISDFALIEKYPHFNWNWAGISKNKTLLSNATFVETGFLGKFNFSSVLIWSEILTHTTFEIDFWNKNLETFHKATDSKNHIEFWKQLTKLEEQQYVLEHYHFPWDWTYVTQKSSPEAILESFADNELFKKWDWEVATRKLNKEIILDSLEDLAEFIDWKFLVDEVFTFDNELSMDGQLPRVAACLSVLEIEKRKDIWKSLTAIYPFETLFYYINSTRQLDAFDWDWDMVSNHRHLPSDIGTIHNFRNNLNWKIFTESNVIKEKFNPANWDNHEEYFENTDNYLATFENFWDWQILSKNRNINYNRNIIKKFRNKKWNWEYLSEFGGFLTKQKRDNDGYLKRLLLPFPNVQFLFLSKRKDILIDTDLIMSYKDRNWDWQVLSENEKAEISIELLLALKDKNWNWKTLSIRNNLILDNDTLLKLADKNWDWSYLSRNSNIIFNSEFLLQTISKPWNWKTVSCHTTFLPTLEMLTLTKDFDLEWQHLSQHPNLHPTRELLAKFEDKWSWHYITSNSQLSFDDFDFIERFADKWDWDVLCETGKLTLTKDILARFKSHLKWDFISSNTNIDFTKEIITEFKPYWNWTALKYNKRVEELLGNYVAKEICESAILTFIDKIEQQYSDWKGHIYHFSHIDNAAQIIKDRKIQSRNKANIRGDAAGNVIHLRNDAHDYARFYFRPQTPTQFYNEYLGKNTTDGYESRQHGWVSWYDKARGLGFPKCPVPIFFRFSLKEVLFKNEEKCCISNGNMQTSSTRFGNIDSMIDKFGFDDLFYTPEKYATKSDYNKYRNYAQQEFLVKDELSFNEFTDYEIICSTNSDKVLLISLLGQENRDIFSKIVVDSSYYNNKNPRIKVEEEESELHISTNFKGNGYFVLNGSKNVKELNILSGDVNKIDENKIIFESYISISDLNQDISLNFIDELGRNWFIYSKGNFENETNRNNFSNLWEKIVSKKLYDPSDTIRLLKQYGFDETFTYKIRHYKLEEHTALVCNIYEKYFVNYNKEFFSFKLFRTLLVLHDIGKTKAFIGGDKNMQYKYSCMIIKSLWKDLPFTSDELLIVLSLLSEDCIGEYFQKRLDAQQAKSKILKLANSCNFNVIDFFEIYMIYYQCDVASYTLDAGGFRYLEHLFEYQNGEKVFDEKERLLKLSSFYWTMYQRLKNEIAQCQ